MKSKRYLKNNAKLSKNSDDSNTEKFQRNICVYLNIDIFPRNRSIMASIPLRQTVAIARFLRIPMTNSKFNTTLRSKFKIPANFNVRQMSNSQHRVIL